MQLNLSISSVKKLEMISFFLTIFLIFINALFSGHFVMLEMNLF
jgi:hypothetical protein